MNKTAEVMFKNHSHVEMYSNEPDKIMYTENAVTKILVHFGIEPPVWDEPRVNPVHNYDIWKAELDKRLIQLASFEEKEADLHLLYHKDIDTIEAAYLISTGRLTEWINQNKTNDGK